MIVRLVSDRASMRASSCGSRQIAAANAEHGHDAEPPQHRRADHAGKLAAVLDVAADDQPIAARQAEHVGEGEPVVSTPPAAGRR